MKIHRIKDSKIKKHKVSAINSYHSYKIQKEKRRRQVCVLIGAMLILFATVYTGTFERDIREFLTSSKSDLLPVETYERDSDNKEVLLPTGQIAYDLYIVPEQSKGIYIPSKRLQNVENYIKLLRDTKMNTVVIDMKDDNGYLTFMPQNDNLKGMAKESVLIEDMGATIRRLNENGIYTIARVVAFKDNTYTKLHPESAIKDKEGNVYATNQGDRWLDPFNKDNWNYLLEICNEIISLGFNEIQFDYVRFHESMKETTIDLEHNQLKPQIITQFIQYISEALHKKNIKVSADVFGAIILSDIDAEIVGQDFGEMSQYLDYISPMIYPSHYADGTFGIEKPHLAPYEIIFRILKRAEERLNEQEGKTAQIRPWLQDFTLANKKPYLKYGVKEIKEQIQGAEDAGVKDWLFWNAAGNYTEEGLQTE